MALRKETETDFGFLANYWRLDSLSYSKKDLTAIAVFSLYKCQDSASLAKVALNSITINFLIEDQSMDLRVAAYNKAKEGQLLGAEDC
jgi:hypothetical protein